MASGRMKDTCLLWMIDEVMTISGDECISMCTDSGVIGSSMHWDALAGRLYVVYDS